MDAFMQISGIIFWLLLLITTLTYLICVILEKLNDRSNKNKEEQQRKYRSDLGKELINTAYWFYGAEYENIHPYVLMTVMGELIRDPTGHVDMPTLRNRCLEKSQKYKEEYDND